MRVKLARPFWIVLIVLASAILAGVLWLMPSALARDIENDFTRSGQRSVDLARAVPQPWSRVCVLGPYTDKAAASKTLGFAWDPSTVSPIDRQDGIMLLVFVTEDNQVAAFSNQWRRVTDFAPVNHQCFPRAKARFVQAAGTRGLSAAP